MVKHMFCLQKPCSLGLAEKAGRLRFVLPYQVTDSLPAGTNRSMCVGRQESVVCLVRSDVTDMLALGATAKTNEGRYQAAAGGRSGKSDFVPVGNEP